MSDMNNSLVPPPTPASANTVSNRKSFPDLVREYIIPYNSLLAVASFLCVVFSYLSPVALTIFAVVLVTGVLQVIVLDMVARDQLAAWSHSHAGVVADITAAFWRPGSTSIFRTSPFWALLLTAVAVVFFTLRSNLA